MKHSKNEQKKIINQMSVLTELAMISRDKLKYITLDYCTGFNTLVVSVTKDPKEKGFLLFEHVWLDEKDALNQLLKIEDEIINLISEVKEVNEIIGEVAK